MEKETFNLEINKETMRKLITLIDFTTKYNPFIPSELFKIRDRFEKILIDGCFKHNLIRKCIRENSNTIITFCPKCAPSLEKEYKNKEEI